MEKLKLKYACTPREEKVITLYRKGMSLSDIAKELGVSSHWVGNIIKHALWKIEEVTSKELIRAKGQHPIMRVPELDTPKTRLIRFVLWESKLRTLEQVAEAGYEKLKNIGLSEKSIQLVAEVLHAYNLYLKGWKEKKNKEANIGAVAKEFEEWWSQIKSKFSAQDLPEVRRAIRRILYS